MCVLIYFMTNANDMLGVGASSDDRSLANVIHELTPTVWCTVIVGYRIPRELQ